MHLSFKRQLNCTPGPAVALRGGGRAGPPPAGRAGGRPLEGRRVRAAEALPEEGRGGRGRPEEHAGERAGRPGQEGARFGVGSDN